MDTLLRVFQSSIDLNQKHVSSFVLTQIIHGISSSISSSNEAQLQSYIELSFSALEAVQKKITSTSTDSSIATDVFDVAIPFCEEMTSMMYQYQQTSEEETKRQTTGVTLDRFAAHLSSMRDYLHRPTHLSLLKKMETEKIQPRVYEDWEEKAEALLHIEDVTFPVQFVVDAINASQLLLFQASIVSTRLSHSSITEKSTPLVNTMCINALYSMYVLPCCCNFLREGRALGAAEVLNNIGRDAVEELSEVANTSFNWHIAENAICFLGNIGHLPAVEAVSIFSTMASCLSVCPCEHGGMVLFLPGEINASSITDPVLKFYYRTQLENSSLNVASHCCEPIPFPFNWMRQLSTSEKRQIQAACNALKGLTVAPSVAPAVVMDVSSDELDLMLAKGDFAKFMSVAKLSQSTFVNYLLQTDFLTSDRQSSSVPRFVKDKILHSVDMSSLEFKSLVEPLLDILPVSQISELVACSLSASAEHLTTRFTDHTGDETASKVLSQIAKICCQKGYINLFLCLFHNSSLKFGDLVVAQPQAPVWSTFFQKSRLYLVDAQSKGFDETFVDDCISFNAPAKHGDHRDQAMFTERLFAYFTQHLKQPADFTSSDTEFTSVLAQYSALLAALFTDIQNVKLDDSRLLYTILRSNMVFDVTKLFRFQSANYLATEEADECLTETFADEEFPPSFLRTSIAAIPAQTKLSSRLKRPEPVSFLGFGRPLRSILQHILLAGSHSTAALSRTRAKLEEKIFNLAVENADNAPIVAACILFYNILGFPAEKLQCAICVLRLLTNNNLTTVASPIAYSPVTFCKLAFYKQERYASEIESVCLNELASINYDLYSSVSTLAVLDRLELAGGSDKPSAEEATSLRPAWSRLMISLATSNNWLGFFTYAEVLRIDADEIAQLASWFSDPHLKSHILKTARGVAVAASTANAKADGEQKSSQQQAKAEKVGGRRRGSKTSRRPTRSATKTDGNMSDSDDESAAKDKHHQQHHSHQQQQQGVAMKRTFKSSSVVFQREHDLLSVVLQVAAFKNEHISQKGADDTDKDREEFNYFIDAVYRSRNPVCAIYAACLPQADRLVCLLAYFHCYFPDMITVSSAVTRQNSTATETANSNHYYQHQHQLPATSNPSFGDSAVLGTLATAIDHLSTKKAYKTLFEGFSILLPSCPLSKLFKSAVSLANQQSIEEFKFALNQFTLALEFYDANLCPELQIEAIAAIAGQFLTRLLYIPETINMYLIKILEIYCECRVADFVLWPIRLTPKQLLGLANQITSTPDDGHQSPSANGGQQPQPISKLLGDDVENVNWSLIGELQARSQYIRARLVGQLLGISLGDILIKEFRHRYSRIDSTSVDQLIDYWKMFTEARRQSVVMSVSEDMLLTFLQSLLDECCKSPLERVFVAYEISRLSANSSSSYDDADSFVGFARINVFLTFYSSLLQYYCDLLPESVAGDGGHVVPAGLPVSPGGTLFSGYFEASLTSAISRGTTANRLLHCRYDVDRSTASNSKVDQTLPNLVSSEVGQLALRVLLDDLLQYGYIGDALLLNKLAGNRSNDLLIVKQCTDLVWGRMGVAELPPPYSSSATVAQAMDRMATDCQSMKTHIDRLRLYYSISVECSLPYAQAETLPALTLCDHLLRRATYNALDLIGRLAKSGDLLAPEDYAVLVSQYVLRYWATDFDVVSSAATDRPVGLDELASRLFQLCPDQTVLGNQLVVSVNQLLAGPGRGFHELSAAVDILVHAHNAFAATNNVEGIASVLHLARTLSRELETGGDAHLQLLVKMMHNIGRYGEMSYVLDILYRSSKLPLVFQLRPRPDCEAQFRTSLLEFLRGVSTTVQSGTQPDLYRHVCLQYGMEREVAQLLYDSAVGQVADLGKLANSADLNTWASEASSALPNAAQKFVDAARGFSRAECPNQADSCIRQARLLALQLRFLSEGTVSTASAAAVQQQQLQQASQLSSGSASLPGSASGGTSVAAGTARQPNLLIIVGRTNPDQIREMIIQQTVAFECLIISEAYKVDCWAEAVFRQVVILAKNSRYFHDLMAILTLNDRFFEELIDIAERYIAQQQQAGNAGLNVQQAGRLKRILHYCPDWTVQYRLAGRLGFSDLQQELANSQATPLIKDLIASSQLQQPSNAKVA